MINFVLMKKIIVFVSFLSLSFQGFGQQYLLDDFKTSIAVVKGGMLIQEKFNYNCVTQSMEFLSEGDIMRLTPINQIDTLYLDTHKMIPYGTRFLDVVYRSSEFSLLVDYKRKIVNEGKVGALGIKTQGTVQNIDLSAVGGQRREEWKNGVDVWEYKEESLYWLVRKNKMKKFNSLKTLQKILPEKKSVIEAYVKEHNTNFFNQNEVLELLTFCLAKT